MPPSTPRDTQRIAKLLARAGIASRREIERMIAERRIAIDGQIVETPATLLVSLHGVTVDGKPVKAPAPARLFRFHKPAGLLTTERDPKGRPTIYSRLPDDLPRLLSVGRLDMNTEGLLLLTTDGELKRQLELPATGVERTYRARAFGEISQEQLEDLIQGIEIEGIRHGPIDANLERRTSRNQWIELKLKESKNREVRRVLEHFGLKISRLIRTAYGPFELEDLPPGAVAEVRQHDLVAFRKMLSEPASRTNESGRRTNEGAKKHSSPGRRFSPKADKTIAAPASRMNESARSSNKGAKKHSSTGRFNPKADRRIEAPASRSSESARRHSSASARDGQKSDRRPGGPGRRPSSGRSRTQNASRKPKRDSD